MKYRRRLHKFRIGGNNIDTDRRSKENHERNDPVLIVQNDVGNKHSPTVIAAAITSQKDKSKLPTHISLNAASCGLAKDSIVLLEQVRTLDKKRLKERMGELDSDAMSQVNTALSVSFAFRMLLTASEYCVKM